MKQFWSFGDALRCILLNTPRSPNLAAPRGRFTPRPAALDPSPTSVLPVALLPISMLPIALLKEGLYQSPNRCTLASWGGLGLKALGSVSRLSGHRAWEVDRLYLPGEDTDELPEILEGLIRYAGNHGAERIFLRVPCWDQYGSYVADAARSAGFFPYFEEALFHGSGGVDEQGQTGSLSLRPRLPHEEFALFQLYSASTPSQVRAGLGMTLEQWRDSGHGSWKGLREEVYERDGRIMAWLASDRRKKPAKMALMAHPDAMDALPALLDYALAGKGAQLWLVPEYLESLERLLIHRGFREVARYSMLIKRVAAGVKRPSLAPVEARVW